MLVYLTAVNVSGADLKPPQAAVVKSDGGERTDIRIVGKPDNVTDKSPRSNLQARV
jgi:hypothetical protein